MKGEIIFYNFVTFNYTRVLDYIIENRNGYVNKMPIEKPIHIHGILGEDIVVGVDNASQFQELHYPTTRKMKRAFIKPIYNEQFNMERVEKAQEIIEKSNIICIYGMSLGETDKTWIDAIARWLLADAKHHLIYFQYCEDTFVSCNGDVKMEEEENRKDQLLKRLFSDGNEAEAVYDNVHIPIGFDIFDFNKRLELEETQAPHIIGPLAYSG